MLYDGAIRFLLQASEAMRAYDSQMRFQRLSRAGEIVLALQSALDPTQGDKEAKQLHDFYNAIHREILALHRSYDYKRCEAVISELRDMREVWDMIDRGVESR